MIVTRVVSSHESSCLAKHVSVHCCLYGLSKKLVFVSVASAMTGAHRECLFLSSFPQQPEIQHLVPQGQIVSADLP